MRLLARLVTTNPWSFGKAKYDGISLASSTEETNPSSIFFKPDGLKLYLTGQATDWVYQYSLSTPWDLSTAVYDLISLASSTEDGSPVGLFLKPDGTKLYLAGQINQKIFQYSLSTAWDLSTASYDSISFASSSDFGATVPVGISFKSDGTKAFIATTGGVFQYSLSTAWASSTATYDSISFSSTAQDVTATDLFIRPDGLNIYVVGSGTDKIFQYSLSTAWASSTASYSGNNFSVNSEDSDPTGVFFKPDGTKMYVSGTITDRVYQYSL